MLRTPGVFAALAALAALAAMAVTASACGGHHASEVLDGLGDATLSDPGTVALLAGYSSAPAAFSLAYLPAGLDEQAADPDCPRRAEDGTRLTLRGGCTAQGLNEWKGKAVITGIGTDELRITYHRFGAEYDAACTDGRTYTYGGTLSGTLLIRRTAEDTYAFDVDIVREGGTLVAPDPCMPVEFRMGLEYAGSLVILRDDNGDGTPEASLWDGAGRFGTTLVGRANAATTAESLDSAICDREATAGTTTLTTGGATAVVTYDGATQCDATAASTWTLDGNDQGAIAIACGVRRERDPRGGSSALFVLALVLTPAVVRRFRTP